jgi:hypothetical protein
MSCYHMGKSIACRLFNNRFFMKVVLSPNSLTLWNDSWAESVSGRLPDIFNIFNLKHRCRDIWSNLIFLDRLHKTVVVINKQKQFPVWAPLYIVYFFNVDKPTFRPLLEAIFTHWRQHFLLSLQDWIMYQSILKTGRYLPERHLHLKKSNPLEVNQIKLEN